MNSQTPDDAIRQGELGERLRQMGAVVGFSKNGNLLRIDFRSATSTNRPLLDSHVISSILQCSQLREVYFTGLEITDDHVSSITQLRLLKVIDLEGTAISDVTLLRLSELPKIQIINARGTRVTAERVAGLRRKMVGTRIIGP